MPVHTQDDFDGYRKWLGISSKQRPPNHYVLLGIKLDEDDSDVIQAAIAQRRAFVESQRGLGHDAVVSEILYRIGEAEVTLLNPEMRREYDRQQELFEKRRKNRQVDPNVSRARVKSRPGRTVGEDGGIVKTFAGIIAIVCVAFGIMAWFSFQLPWSKKAEQVEPVPVAQVQLPAPAQAAQAPAPVKFVEPEKPKKDVVEDATAKVMKSIQGEWIMFESEIRGKPYDFKKQHVFISGSSINYNAGADDFVLDATNGHFDYSLRTKRGNLKDAIGIYKLEGDTLKMCYRYNVDGTAVRPTEFKTDDGHPNTTVFHTFKRVGLESLESTTTASTTSESKTLKNTGCRVVWMISENGESTLTLSRPLEKRASKDFMIRHDDGTVEFQHDFDTQEAVDKALMGGADNVEFDKSRIAMVLTPKKVEGAKFAYAKLAQLPITLDFDIDSTDLAGGLTLIASINRRDKNVEFPVLNLASKDGFKTSTIVSCGWVSGRDAKGGPQFDNRLAEQAVELGERKVFTFKIPGMTGDQPCIINFGVRGDSPAILRHLTVRGRLKPTLGIGLSEKNGEVIVEKVLPKGLGETVGIKAVDVLVSINGNKPMSMKEAMESLGKIPLGEESEIVVKRNGKTVKIGFTAE